MLTRNNQVRLSVGFILARQFTLSALALFVDALRLASDREDRGGRCLCDWQILGSSRDLIRASCGFDMAPTMNLASAKGSDFDYIVIVGGTLTNPNPIDLPTETFLRECVKSGTKLVGLCTGSFILARLGILDGKAACVSWLHREQFRNEFPNVRVISDMLFLAGNRIITCSGGTSSADLAAHLVDKHVGRAAVRNAMSIMLIDRLRDGAELQPSSPLALDTRHFTLRRAVAIMDENVAEPLPISKLAYTLEVSTRQLERVCEQELGLSPHYLYLAVRLLSAWKLIVETEFPMIEVAICCGFASGSTFSRRFGQIFGVLPSELRGHALEGTQFRHPALRDLLELRVRPLYAGARNPAGRVPWAVQSKEFMRQHIL